MVATYEQNRHSYLGGVEEREGEHPEASFYSHAQPAPDAARLVSVYNELAYVARCLDDPDLTGQLKLLIEESAKALARAETCFAVDGKMFGYDGTDLRPWGAQYHLACGVNTGIVAAVEAGGPEDYGSRLLPGLLRTVRENFPGAEELYAGRAYLSKANFEAAETLSLTLYVPFRTNSTFSPSGQCPAWDRALYFYQRRHEEFLRRYRRYSAVEDALDTIEAGAGVWACAGSDTAQLNAALIRIAAHNTRVVAEWTDGAVGEPEFGR